MIYIGIDPGKKGAYALLKIAPGQAPDAEVYPWDEVEFVERMSRIPGFDSAACLEHVGPMPGQGVTSMFNFGQTFGFIQGVLEACAIPYQLVRPQKWKKEFSVTADKNSSIAVCKRLFPHVSLKRSESCRKDDDGLAEALLMAEYARRKFGNGEE